MAYSASVHLLAMVLSNGCASVVLIDSDEQTVGAVGALELISSPHYPCETLVYELLKNKQKL